MGLYNICDIIIPNSQLNGALRNNRYQKIKLLFLRATCNLYIALPPTRRKKTSYIYYDASFDTFVHVTGYHIALIF